MVLAVLYTWQSQKKFDDKGSLLHNTGDKKFYLDYHLDMLDTDLLVGISINLDGTYYNLKKFLLIILTL